jgi:hypothetical protein
MKIGPCREAFNFNHGVAIYYIFFLLYIAGTVLGKAKTRSSLENV